MLKLACVVLFVSLGFLVVNPRTTHGFQFNTDTDGQSASATSNLGESDSPSTEPSDLICSDEDSDDVVKLIVAKVAVVVFEPATASLASQEASLGVALTKQHTVLRL